MTNVDELLPRHKIIFGKSVRVYYLKHLAEQFTAALMMNGTPYQWFINDVLYEEYEQ